MKKILFIGAMFLGGVGAAFGQAFPNYPTVGVPANTQCLSYGNNGVCNQYRPAGPNSLTGNETVPADTNLSSGGQPQTVRVPVVVLGAGSTVYNAPLTGASVTVAAQNSNVVLSPAGTIAALTLVLPAASSLSEGQILRVGSSQTVTALTLTPGTGTTIVGGPTTIAAAGGFSLIYNETNATSGVWRRLQ